MTTEFNEILVCVRCEDRRRRSEWPEHPTFGFSHCAACRIDGRGSVTLLKDSDQSEPGFDADADTLDLARCALELVAVVRDAGTRPRAGGDRARLSELMAEVDRRALATAKRLKAAAAEGGGSCPTT